MRNERDGMDWGCSALPSPAFGRLQPLTAVLIERAQFALNKKIYDPQGFKDQIDFEGSWLDWFLFETESFHAKARRFTRWVQHSLRQERRGARSGDVSGESLEGGQRRGGRLR